MPTETPLIGLVELPDLVPPVSAAGFTPVSGADLRSTATDIRSALTDGSDMAVVAMQTRATGLRPFLTRVTQSLPPGRRVALLVPPGADPIDVPGAQVVVLPAALPDVFAAAGISPDPTTAAKLAAVMVGEDGTPQLAKSVGRPEPADDDWLSEDDTDTDSSDDPWDDDDQTGQSGLDEPPLAQVQQFPAPASPVDDPWGDEPAPAPAPQAWSTTTAPVEQSQPAPAWDDQPDVPRIGADPQPAATAQQPTGPTPAGVAPYRPQNAPQRVQAAPGWPVGPQTGPTPAQAPSGPPAAPWGAPTASQAPAAAAAPVDPLDMFGVAESGGSSQPAFTQQRTTDLAPVVIVFSGKGGVGKTSLSINVPQRAADVSAGLRAALIDMNRGQGDVRKYLRVSRHNRLRSMFDAAVSGDPASAVLAPDELNAARHQRLSPARFAIALAPVEEQCDPTMVTPEVYAAVIDMARRHSDLVVVDTQIVEAADTTGLIDHVVVPLLRSGAWGVAVTDTSNAGVDNLRDVLQRFARLGVPRDRILMVVNKIADNFAEQNMLAVFGDLAAEFHRIDNDSTIHQQMNLGRFVHAHPQMAPTIDAVLYRVLGRSEFDHSDEDQRKSRKGFKLFRRGR